MSSGGYSHEKPADADVIGMANTFKSQIQAQTGKHFSTFTPVSYQVQVVAGLNYKIRIAIDGGKHVIATIYEQLPCAGGSRSLTDVKLV